jgi:hypothetical protein
MTIRLPLAAAIRRTSHVCRQLAAIAPLALVLGFGAFGLAGPASAQEGDGVLTLEADERTATGYHFVIRLVWENGGQPAARDTSIRAILFTPDGVPQTPSIAMTPVDADGRFEVTVEMNEPGRWSVVFTSENPKASAAFLYGIDGTSGTPSTAPSTAPPTTESATTERTTTPATSSEAGDVAANDQASEASTAASRDSGDGGADARVLVAAIAAIVVALLTVAAWLRRRGPGHAADHASAVAEGAADDSDDSSTKVGP